MQSYENLKNRKRGNMLEGPVKRKVKKNVSGKNSLEGNSECQALALEHVWLDQSH